MDWWLVFELAIDVIYIGFAALWVEMLIINWKET